MEDHERVGSTGEDGERERTLEAAVTVTLFCLHLLVNKPQRVLGCRWRVDGKNLD